MAHETKKDGMTWGEIDPDVLAYARDQHIEDPTPELVEPFQPRLPAGVTPVPSEKPKDLPDRSGPERLIGPRNPDHPQINQKPGGLGPV